MLAKVLSGANVGLESILVTVEVDVSSQSLPSFSIVGLPGKEVEESKERVRAALKNSGAAFPDHRIIVNLAPADLPKEGPAYDLPIALGMLIASGQLQEDIKNNIFYGELSLDGSLTYTKGILPIALLAKSKKIKGLYIPEVNSQEASIVTGVKIYPIKSLLSLFRHFTNSAKIRPFPPTAFKNIIKDRFAEFDLSDIKGQEQAKRALELSAAGGHNLSMTGVPGAGKTMLARALPGILPDLTEHEALEVTKIYSVTGNIPPGTSIITTRPFRAPHHTTSRIGLIGGGSHPMPGEISLSHRGVLFLDEFPEFPRHVLEALRQPIEDGIVSISRAQGTVTYPAKFVLIVASNPCPCGYFGDPVKPCRCLPGAIDRYRKKVSGPILDRIDIHLTVSSVRVDKLTDNQKGENSQKVQKRVQKARDIQSLRFQKTLLVCNADMDSKSVKELCPLDSECLYLLKKAVATLHLSARSYYRTIKLARTIADMEASQNIGMKHIAEALQYRYKDQK